MKKYNQFIAENKADNTYAAKRSAPKAAEIVSKGKLVGRIPQTDYRIYEYNNEYWQVVVRVNGRAENPTKVNGYPRNMVKESTDPDAKYINALIAKFAETGRTAHYYPKRKTISISGRQKPVKDAIEIMRGIIGTDVKESVGTTTPEGYDIVPNKPYMARTDKRPASKDNLNRDNLWMHTDVKGKPRIVTFKDEKLAKKYAKQFNAKIYVTNINTFRLYKPRAVNKVEFKEDAANSVGTAPGNIAGVSDNDPPVSQKKVLKRSKFAGAECFEVDADTFQKCRTGHMKNERWDKYLTDVCDQCKAIKAYSQRHPQKDIVIQREGCGTMSYLKKQGTHY